MEVWGRWVEVLGLSGVPGHSHFHMQDIFFPVQSERQAGPRSAGLVCLGLRGRRQGSEMSVLQNFLPHAEPHPSLGIRNPGELWGLSSPCPSEGCVTVPSRTCTIHVAVLCGVSGATRAISILNRTSSLAIFKS